MAKQTTETRRKLGVPRLVAQIWTADRFEGGSARERATLRYTGFVTEATSQRAAIVQSAARSIAVELVPFLSDRGLVDGASRRNAGFPPALVAATQEEQSGHRFHKHWR